MSEAEEDVIASLVTSVYHDVWDEFYAWDHEFSTAAILSLQRDRDIIGEPSQSESTAICTPQSFTSNWTATSDLLRWEYPRETVVRRKGSTHMIDFQSAHLKAPKMDPFPSYESCAPISTSAFVGDDPDIMPFVPFPGESFNFDGYHAHYDDFAWEKRRLDPDLETIILESIRRLDTYHDVPLDDIRRIILPDMRLSRLGERDLLQWLPFRMLHKDIPKAPSLPERSDTKARLEGIVNNFCPNLNCIETFCALHETNPTIGPPNYVSLDEKRQSASGPCGPDCFLSVDGRSVEDDREQVVDEIIRNTMTAVLSVCPDLTTCQLAIACCRSCKETHAIRRKLSLPVNERPSCMVHESALESVSDDTVLEKLDYFTSDFEPDLPCHHAGPCDSSADCPCYHNRAYCEKSCRCSPRCIRRFRGCKCKVSNKQKPYTCTSRSCPCLNSGRECDPEVCVSCKLTYVSFGYGRCFNSQIQRGESKRTIVKKGKYGMGLFVDEAVHKGELILEYTGELIFESTVDCRNIFYLFHGRNYLYKLSELFTIDAARLGNESRFINHDKGKVNCDARYFLVNGMLRIGIFAMKGIKRGTELHLDYGNQFFQDERGESVFAS